MAIQGPAVVNDLMCVECKPLSRMTSTETRCSSFSRTSSSKSSEETENEKRSARDVAFENSWNLEIKNTFIHMGEIQGPDGLQRSASAPALLLQFREEKSDLEEDLVRSPEEVVAARAAMEKAHYSGLCKPCQYFAMKADSCRKGDFCSFCHLCTRQDVQAGRKAQRRRNLHNSMQLGKWYAGGKLPNRVSRAQRYVQTKPWAPEIREAGQRAAAPIQTAPAHAPPVGTSGHREIAQPHFSSMAGMAPKAAGLAAPPGNHWNPANQTRVTKMAGGRVQIQLGAVPPR